MEMRPPKKRPNAQTPKNTQIPKRPKHHKNALPYTYGARQCKLCYNQNLSHKLKHN